MSTELCQTKPASQKTNSKEGEDKELKWNFEILSTNHQDDWENDGPYWADGCASSLAL